MSRRLLVVDAANVMGARPDGWWKDRAGAARRLLSKLAEGFAHDDRQVVVVLEGEARKAADEGDFDGGILVVHAPRVGDDTIVDVVAAAREVDPEVPVTVVTADRELRDRVAALGAETMGPRTLWERLERVER
jgi:predicted RNA-binding protein with PIN domain